MAPNNISYESDAENMTGSSEPLAVSDTLANGDESGLEHTFAAPKTNSHTLGDHPLAASDGANDTVHDQQQYICEAAVEEEVQRRRLFACMPTHRRLSLGPKPAAFGRPSPATLYNMGDFLASINVQAANGAEVDAMRRSHAERASNLESLVKDKDNMVADLKEQLSGMRADLVLKESVIKDKDSVIASLTEQVDGVIASLTEQLASIRADHGAALALKDSVITGKDSVIASITEQLASMRADHDAALALKESVITDKGSAIANLEVQLVNVLGAHDKLIMAVQEQDEQIVALGEANADLNAELTKVYAQVKLWGEHLMHKDVQGSKKKASKEEVPKEEEF